MKEKILTIINDKKYQPLTTIELGQALALESESELSTLQKELDQLVINDEILMNKKKTRYISLASAGLYRGINYQNDFSFDRFYEKRTN
jgi:hypothetical protein